MLLVYQPDDVKSQEYVFDPDKVSVVDAEEIEELGGNTWRSYREFAVAYAEGKVRALRVALFICMRKDKPDMAFEHMDSYLAADITKRFETQELLTMRRAHLESDQAPDVIRVNVGLIDELLAARGVTPPDDDDGELLDPKAEASPSPNDSPTPKTRSATAAKATGGASRSGSTAPRRNKTDGPSKSSTKPAT